MKHFTVLILMMDVYRDNPVTIYNVTGIMGKSFKKVST
jgi:hypothetical protein